MLSLGGQGYTQGCTGSSTAREAYRVQGTPPGYRDLPTQGPLPGTQGPSQAPFQAPEDPSQQPPWHPWTPPSSLPGTLPGPLSPRFSVLLGVLWVPESDRNEGKMATFLLKSGQKWSTFRPQLSYQRPLGLEMCRKMTQK